MNYQHMTAAEIEARLYAEGNSNPLLLMFVQEAEEADDELAEAWENADKAEKELDQAKDDLEHNVSECTAALEQVDQAIALLDAKELDDAKNLLENVASILAIICE